jgi:probable HAF family extracellular repeat protein
MYMKTRCNKLLETTLALVVLLTCTPLYAQTKPKFTYQSLGTLGGTKSTAEGINDLGEVVGNADLADGSSAPYLYTPAAGMKNLNVLTEGPMDTPGRPLFGPDGRFYVCNHGASAGRGSVAVFNPLTGDFLEMFVPVGSGGLENPADMTFGPNGDLYVPSHNGPGTGRNRILRFSGTTGTYLGEFVPYGYGGVNAITCLTFGPDVGGGPNGERDGNSDLFVSCALTNEVMVFSGVDGTFIKVFVTAGAGGLQSPGTHIFRAAAGQLELLVASRLTPAVLRYDGLTGAFIDVFASFPGVNKMEDIQFGPDGDLYVTAISDNAQVLRFDGETGQFIEVFIPPHAGGWSSAAPRFTFDGVGDLYVNNSDTNQILRFQGPLSSNPGAFSDVFVQGVGFILLTARDINSSGQIVGVGYPLGRRNITGSRKAAYRYTPPAAGEL